MSEWITDRLPTEDDADAKGCVYRTERQEVLTIYFDCVKPGEPWQPTNRPPPYVATKPKRREWTMVAEGDIDERAQAFLRPHGRNYLGVHVREVMPGDPSDLDALLAAVDEMLADYDKPRRHFSCGHEKLREARQ